MIKNIKHQEQGVVQVIVVIILIVALIATVLVVSNPNIKNFIFKSRADNPPITFKDANGNALPQEGGLPVTTTQQVQIELEAPSAP